MSQTQLTLARPKTTLCVIFWDEGTAYSAYRKRKGG
jgi:hypothetical protein